MTVNARLRYCGVNDGFWIQRAAPSFFFATRDPAWSPRFGAPRPERPRDPASPRGLGAGGQGGGVAGGGGGGGGGAAGPDELDEVSL